MLLACTLCACQLASGLDKLHTREDAVTSAGSDAPGDEAGKAAERMDGSVGGGGGRREDGSHVEGGRGGTSAPNDNAAIGGMGAHDPVAPPARDGTQAGAGSHAVGGASGAADGGGAGGVSGHAAGGDGSAPACNAPQSGGASCDPAAQCGCAEGENCALYGGRLACLQSGSVQPNQACNAPVDCMRGYQCDHGACLRACDQTHPDCEGGAMCRAIYDEAGKPTPGVFDCDSNCNLVDPTSDADGFHTCGPGLTCVRTPSGSVCGKRTGSGGGHGELCDGNASCAIGFGCAPDGTCVKWCVSSSDCPDGFSCRTGVDVRVATQDFGLCTPTCSRPGNGSCATSPQCGCDSDLSCDVLTNAQGKFVYGCRSFGSIQAYASCTQTVDCARGTVCADSVCEPLCSTDASCGERYTRCVSLVKHDSATGSETPVAGYASCVRPCDPLNAAQPRAGYSPCLGGRACLPVEDGHSVCRDVKALGVVNDACSVQEDCAARYSCVKSGSDSPRCQLLCRLLGADCGSGTCRAGSPRIFAGDTEWGYCDPTSE